MTYNLVLEKFIYFLQAVIFINLIWIASDESFGVILLANEEW